MIYKNILIPILFDIIINTKYMNEMKSDYLFKFISHVFYLENNSYYFLFFIIL